MASLPARIVHVVTKLDYGGAQTIVRELATEQHRRGSNVTVITGLLGPASAELVERGVTVCHEPTLTHALHPRNDVRALQRLIGHLSESTPDVVHTHSSKGGLLGRWAARRLSLPVVYTAHGWPFQTGAPLSQRIQSYAGERWSARSTGPIVCVTAAELSLAVRMRVCAAERLHLIHNGIGHADETHKPLAEPTSSDRLGVGLRLVMIARFAAPKRQDLIVDAIRDLPDVHVTFAGDGHGLAAIRQRAATLGDRVSFAGFSEPADVLVDADVVVLASDYEGLPLSVIEAMRAGKPVIASRLPGLRDAVTDAVTGLLVANTVPGFRSALAILRDPQRRAAMGAAARADWAARFTIDRMADRYGDVYEQAISEHR